MPGAEAQNHHASHRGLLWPYDRASAQANIDALIVPTIRTPALLRMAADIAAKLDCPLVTLHSQTWTKLPVIAQRLRADIDLIAIDVRDHSRLGLPELKTSRLLAGTRFDRRTDTSAKRNLGLVLSRLLGWERIAFLDDDIEVPDPDDLARASALLEDYHAVGMANVGYPDNSVVCHAYRAVGGDQETFIGGGALVVSTVRNHSFFPSIYNEDWFYLLDAEKGIQPLGMAGRVVQRPYDPFRTPERARAEELGDVLAEGAFWRLDEGLSAFDATDRHWSQFIANRKRFIEFVLEKVQDGLAEQTAGERGRMVAALKAARGRVEYITPDLCLSYLRALGEDRRNWQSYLDSRRTGQPLSAALDAINKLGARPLHRPARRRTTLPPLRIPDPPRQDPAGADRRSKMPAHVG